MIKLRNINSKVITWCAFAAAVLLMFYLRPTTNENRYIYEINRPWNYNLLTAPFDIPVHHDTISSMAIRDSLAASFEPVYVKDNAIESQILAKSATRLLKVSTNPLNAAQRTVLLAKLRDVYQTGVIDVAALPKRPDSSAVAKIRLLDGDLAESQPVTSFLTPRQAYARLDSLIDDPTLHNAVITARLSELMEPNVLLDSAATKRFREEAYATALAPIGVIQHGERIIDRGDIVTPQLYTILSTYEQLVEERGGSVTSNSMYRSLGTFAFILIMLGAVMAYTYFFRRDYYNSLPTMLCLLLLITIFTLMAYAMNHFIRLGLYVVPFAIVPVVVLVFLDSRTAFFTGIATVLICSTATQNHWEFIVLQMAAVMAAVVSIRELSKRSQLIRTSVVVFLTYAMVYAAMELMLLGTFNSLVPRMLGALAVNALLISFAYFLIFLFEKLFGFTSRVSLVELADINHPLLRELSEECPGTFNHSMAVSNLASAAASRIGANVQLTRTGALYHDIGKIKNPAFFTENQHGVNPHNALTPLQSARIVIGHVTDGLRRADESKLPKSIRDFIAQHHGRGKARYFYTTYCNQHPGEEVDPAPFTYPGPNPQSREASIVMMADSVEAASRSLTDHSPEAISALVNKIIDQQIAEGLHNESPLSFRDVNEIKNVFVSRLRSLYHSRISYPEAIKPATPPANEQH
ncbi:MAG: HDIG domain-containing protein [Firmicutes bacterium]|nr:HDIG domain-containing protein [Bacillota bacterium]MCM1400406.1 HDIG domain-containing protein [Bacteroides sp.]MCM1477163.1 HDIG domain-containing protein [Bacteroides sp.]